MNLREAYLFIKENGLKDFIKKWNIQVSSIKFMLEEQIVISVPRDQVISIDALMNTIKGEIVARYILNKVKLKEERFYFRIEEKEGRTFDITGVKVTEKKDELTEFIEQLETDVGMSQVINDCGQHDEKIKRYTKIIAYLKELQEVRKTLRKTHEMLNMWDDL